MSYIPNARQSLSPAPVDSEPPAYNASDDAHEGFVQQTTTTITTTTTTSFFPGLRKRKTRPTTTEGASKSSPGTGPEMDTANSLLIHKELPQLPEHRIGVPILKSRPKTADNALETERRASAVGVTMPFALAHATAAIGIKVPSVPPVSPGWSLDQLSGNEDPVERNSSTATPRPLAQDSSKRRHSLSLGEDTYSTLADDPGTQPAVPGAQSSSVQGIGKLSERPTTSVWGSLTSLTPHNAPKKSWTMQPGLTSVEVGTPGKQITRRASWWIRRKAESPMHSPTSSFGQPNDFGRAMNSFDSPVVDLSYSPPDATFASHDTTSTSTPLDMAITERSEISQGWTQSPPAPERVASPVNASSSRRPRSVSLFLKPTPPYSSDFIQPSNGQLSPTSASHARQKTGQTPPLIRRISTNFFSQSPYSSTSPTPHSSLSISGSLVTKPSTEQMSKVVPRPKIDEETPEGYVQRLTEAVTKAEIAVVLASSGDEFHSEALKFYLGKFSFKGDPLDIAVRRLLMDLALPRETQQIDRVMEAFSTRYTECNPGLFAQPDQAYILAFSLIMLHTDAFNKSNKSKMTKASYIKNTRLPGVYPEVLDYFFDNIVFAPFIFIEDPLDVNGQRGFSADLVSPSSGFRSKSNKIDPYYLITSGLDSLRLRVETFIPRKTPYKYLGTAASWDHEELRQAFAGASVVELGDRESSRRQASMAVMASAGFTSMGPSVMPLSFSGHSGMAPTAFNDVWTFKLTKIGVINRKDDVLEGGKKSTARKWRQFKVALTGSQLLFFKDLRWDHQLSEKPGGGRVLTLPHASMVKPDEVLSVNDAIAVLDLSYTKYRNTFRLVLPKGRQYLMQVLDEHELNEWIARINYASAFRTAGLRMRATGLSGRDVELTGIAAANSHARETVFWQQQVGSPPAAHNWTSPDANIAAAASIVDTDTDEEPPFSAPPSSGPRPMRLLPVSRSTARVDLESPGSSVHEEAEQMKVAFEDVKAELAANLSLHTASSEGSLSRKNTNRSYKSSSAEKLSVSGRMSQETDSPRDRVSSRGNVIRLKVEELEKKISGLYQQLESDLRHARNLATLTPFQQTTRNRLHEQVLILAKRVALERLELTKLRCHREVLHSDFMSDERQRYQTTRAALKIATATLKGRLGETSSRAIKSPGTRSTSHRATTSEQLRQNSFASSSSSNQGGGSANDTSSQLERLELTPRRLLNRSLPAADLPPGPQDLDVFGIDEPASALEDTFQENKQRSSEQAEEWNKTRAAKRVSLVTLHPENLKPFAARAQLDEGLGPLKEASSS